MHCLQIKSIKKTSSKHGDAGKSEKRKKWETLIEEIAPSEESKKRKISPEETNSTKKSKYGMYYSIPQMCSNKKKN